MAGPIAISILADGDRARRELNSVGDTSRRMGATMAKAGRVAAIGLAAVATAAVAGAVAAGKLAAGAAEDEQGARRYAQTLEKVTGATRAQIAASEAWITKQGEALGVTDDQLRPALSKLVTATKDVGQAQKLASLAMDVSAGTGKSLEQVSTALTRAQNGSVSSLSRLGINTKNAAGETISMREAVKRMSDTFGGAASSNAESLQGRLDRLKLRLSEAGEAIGYRLLPPLLDFADFAEAKGIPVIERIASTLAGALAPPLQAVGGFVGDLVARVQQMVGGFESGSSALTPVTEALATYAGTLQNVVIPAVVAVAGYVASQLGPVLAQVADIVANRVVPVVSALAQFLYGTLVPAVVEIATKVGSNLRPVFEALVANLQNQVLPAVSRLLATFEKYRPTIQRVIVVVAQVVGKVLEFAAAVLGKVLPPLIRFSGFLTGTTVSAIIGVITVIAKVITKAIDFGKAFVNAAQRVAEFQAKVAAKVADVLSTIGALPGKVKDALAGAIDWLYQAGKDIIQGLLNGIDALIGQVTSRLTSLKNKIPGGKLLGDLLGRVSASATGFEFISGLIGGFQDGTAGLEKALTGVTDRVEASVDRGLAGAERAIDGRYDAIEKKLRKRLKGKALDKALDRNEAARDKSQAKAEKRSEAQQRALLAIVRAHRPALMANARAQDEITEALKTATGEWESLVKASADYVEQVRAAVVASASITSFGGGTGFGSIDQLIAQRTAGVAKAERFTDVINQLIGAGLNTQDLQDLIASGVDAGLGTAEALLAGGPGVIATMNALSARLNAAGVALGQSAADKMYAAGVAAAAALVAGLASQQAALDAVAAQLAAALAGAIAAGAAGDGGKKKGGKGGGKKNQRTAAADWGRTAASAFEASVSTKSAATTAVQVVVQVAPTADKVAIGKEIQGALDAYFSVGGRAAS